MNLDTRYVCGAAEDIEIWEGVAWPGAVIDTLPAIADITELATSISARLPTGRRTVLVGHSLGAAVSLMVAATHTSQVAGLVLVACGAALPVHPVIWSTLEADGEVAVAKLLARAAVPRSEGEGSGGSASIRMSEMMARAKPGTLTAHLHACADFSAEAAGCPAVVLAGAADRVVTPELSGELAELVGARLILLEGVGHQVPWERPDAVREAVDAVIASGRQ